MTEVIYQVAPRYTPGSPAQVDAKTAQRVAQREREAYQDILDHPDEQPLAYQRAKLEGLAGIAEALSELPRGRGWDVHDLITDQRFQRTDRTYLTRSDGAALARDLDTLKALVARRGADWVRKWTIMIDGQAAGDVGNAPDPRD